MSNCLFKLLDGDDSDERSEWSIILEYALLTNYSKKDIKQRIMKLEQYYDFYGYHIGDPTVFVELATEFLSHTEKIYADILKLRSSKNSDELSQKAKIVNNLKNLYKEVKFDHSYRKSKYYIFNNRIVTPLLLANLKIAEHYSVEKTGPDSNMEEKFKHLNLGDGCKELVKPVSEQGPHSMKQNQKSIKPGPQSMKRSYKEMQKVTTDNYDMFSPEALSAIFAYMDYLAMRMTEKSQCLIIGHFAVVLYEVKATELRDIHKRIGIEMPYDNINLRVIKPSKSFYNDLIQIALKFGLSHLSSVTLMDFINALKHNMGQSWNPGLSSAIEFFLECCKGLSKEITSRGIVKFFDKQIFPLTFF